MSNILRLTGVCVGVERREGTSGSGAAYSFDVLRVMVPDTDFVEVVRNGKAAHPFVTKGETVDALVRVNVGKGGFLRLDLLDVVPPAVAELA